MTKKLSWKMIFFKRAKLHSHSGLTLVELLISVFILVPLFTIGMQTFIKCIELSDMAQNSSIAVQGIKSLISSIEATPYDQISNNYNNTTFSLIGINGIGKTYVDSSSPNHLIVNLAFCWRERSGRVMGEDKDLNGVLDAGEDLNGNGQIDSTVTVTTQIYNM